MTKTHYFSSTREAYYACMIDDDIKAGDTLVVGSERVVGVAHTWPVAVTAECGNLHQIVEFEGLPLELVEGIKRAKALALTLGF